VTPYILTLTALTVISLLAWRWLRMRRPVRVVREAEAVAAVYWPTEGGA